MDIKKMENFIKETFGNLDLPFEIYPLSVRGSERTFYRINWACRKSAILIHYDPIRKENMFYAEIGSFLKNISVNVPEIYAHDPLMHLMLVEDLGDTDLYSLKNQPWLIRRGLYEKTLENIIKLHSYPLNEFPFHNVRTMEGFDVSLYRWEHQYFIENFVIGLLNIKHEDMDMDRFKKELDKLIEKLLNSQQCLIHRDFQSQNVLIKDGMPFFIDFQGMRIGNPMYDLGSILNDPYVEFSNEEREYLLNFYYSHASMKIPIELFMELFWSASCQRLMQALGAFAYLGVKKGIKSFLKYIPVGIKNLMEAVYQNANMPYLLKTIETCYNTIKSKKFIE